MHFIVFVEYIFIKRIVGISIRKKKQKLTFFFHFNGWPIFRNPNEKKKTRITFLCFTGRSQFFVIQNPTERIINGWRYRIKSREGITRDYRNRTYITRLLRTVNLLLLLFYLFFLFFTDLKRIGKKKILLYMHR